MSVGDLSTLPLVGKAGAMAMHLMNSQIVALVRKVPKSFSKVNATTVMQQQCALRCARDLGLRFAV